MKNKRWFRLIGWLLSLVMILTIIPAATFAGEGDTGNTTSDELQPVPEIIKTSAEEDITDSVQFAYTDASGKTVKVEDMNPNQENRMTLTVSGLNGNQAIVKETVMSITLPEDIKITSKGLEEFSNDAVSVSVTDGKLYLSWKGEKQDAVTATFAILPNIKAENDLSGSYVLGTARKSMLGTRTFRDKEKNRDKLYASVYTETGSKIRPATDENPVWVLEHVSGNYYTVRAQNTNKYIYISPVAKDQYSASSLYLVEGNSETAQKIQVKPVGDGYYSFTFKHTDNKEYAINNSGNDKEGNSAIRGFGCWPYEGNPNEKFKLYSPGALDNSATVDLSGTWVITNTNGKVSLTSEASQAKSLKGMAYSLKEGVTIAEADAVTFVFEHVIRDWYTVKADAGYLNIAADGAYISSTPQRLMAKTEDNFATIMLTTGEYLDSNEKYCPTYALNCTNKVFGSVLSRKNVNTRMQLVSSSEVANANTRGFLYFNINEGTGAEVPQTITGEAGEKVILPDLNATKNSQEFIGWAEVSDIYAKNPGRDLRYHEVYKPGTNYELKTGTTKLYAIYNQQVRTVRFGIRADGVIQDEPNNYDVKNYIGHFSVDGILKEGHWVIDIDATKPVNGYYLENDVTNNLNWVPSAEQIAAALKTEGNVDFDPETQYVHYYVMKTTGVNVWKVDGVIRNKSKVAVTYNTNISGVAKTDIKNMPGSKQVVSGTEITIGTDDDGNVLRPVRAGYVFKGWNTEPDGSGTPYSAGRYMRLTSNLNLYAQWEEGVLSIDITPDWPEGKPAPSGTMITLTAGLHGFEDLVEGEDYILQWRYSTDLENWIDEPGAHGITFTYELNVTTATYTWKVVAVKPQE